MLFENVTETQSFCLHECLNNCLREAFAPWIVYWLPPIDTKEGGSERVLAWISQTKSECILILFGEDREVGACMYVYIALQLIALETSSAVPRSRTAINHPASSDESISLKWGGF